MPPSSIQFPTTYHTVLCYPSPHASPQLPPQGRRLLIDTLQTLISTEARMVANPQAPRTSPFAPRPSPLARARPHPTPTLALVIALTFTLPRSALTLPPSSTRPGRRRRLGGQLQHLGRGRGEHAATGRAAGRAAA